MKNIIETLNEGQEFDYQKLSQEEQRKRGILGRLVGVIADTKNPTRNGRRYSAELWENVFNNPIMIEKINNRVCFGEICHPFDGREEVDPEKVAVCLAEVPKKNSKGQLVGVFDILDSPCGRILKTMCDYGTTIGVSSRGTGDLITDYDGNEAVDPSTYDCTGFDIVFIPAVKEARLKYVTESLDKKKYNKTLREKLAESIEQADKNDQRIMKEALRGSGIVLDESLFDDIQDAKDNLVKTYGPDIEPALDNYIKQNPDANVFFSEDDFNDFFRWAKSKGYNLNKDNEVDDLYLEGETSKDEKASFIDEVLGESISEEKGCIKNNDRDSKEAVDNNEAILEELQNILKQNQELEQKIIELQEKLSACYTKEANLTEDLNKARAAGSKLTESTNKVNALETKLNSVEDKLKMSESKLEESLTENKQLRENFNEGVRKRNALRESIKAKDSEIATLTESLETLKKKSAAKEEELTALSEGLKKDLEISKSNYSKKLAQSNGLVEKYKGIASSAVDRYIESQASKIGVSKNEVKNRLPESYTFKDIDEACDSLRQYKSNMNKLPFQTRLNESMKIKAVASTPAVTNESCYAGDDIDDMLLSLAGINK